VDILGCNAKAAVMKTPADSKAGAGHYIALRCSAPDQAAELPQSTARLRKIEMTGLAKCGTLQPGALILPEMETCCERS
jgi:hypothetical protein